MYSSSKERKGIDVGTFPIAFGIGDQGDGKVKVIVPSSGVSGVANISNDVTLAHVVSFGEARSVAREVGVIEDQVLTWTKLIDRHSTTLALKEFHNPTIGCGKHRSSGRRCNINRIMNAAF